MWKAVQGHADRWVWDTPDTVDRHLLFRSGEVYIELQSGVYGRFSGGWVYRYDHAVGDPNAGGPLGTATTSTQRTDLFGLTDEQAWERMAEMTDPESPWWEHEWGDHGSRD